IVETHRETMSKEKNKKKNLVSPTVGAVITVCVLHHNPFVTAFTTPLNFKLFYLLKDVLLRLYHLLFFAENTACF
ncbi:MAG: hypothetical protein AABX37_01135, partial [Nanoarchaeota archaeon]